MVFCRVVEMGNYTSSKLCEDDPDLYDEDSSEIATSSGIVDMSVHKLVAHPLTVLRRQCQLNAWSRKAHITPFSLLPVIYRLAQKQKIEAFFRGIHGVVILDVSTFVCEGLLSVYTGLPSYALHHQDWDTKSRFYLVKFVAACLAGPMYATVVQTTVTTFRGTSPRAAMDFLMSAADRYAVWHIPGSSHPLRRMMPVWIIGPLYGTYVVSRLFIASSIQWRLFIWLKHRKEKPKTLPDVADHAHKESLNTYLSSTVSRTSTKGTIGNILTRYESRAVALVITDFLLYPMEVILNRLCVQGTKVTIDNLDTGLDAVPTVFSYKGPFQCAGSIIKAAGPGGFYKGIGILGLQATLYLMLFGTVHLAVSYFELDDKKLTEKETS